MINANSLRILLDDERGVRVQHIMFEQITFENGMYKLSGIDVSSFYEFNEAWLNSEKVLLYWFVPNEIKRFMGIFDVYSVEGNNSFYSAQLKKAGD